MTNDRISMGEALARPPAPYGVPLIGGPPPIERPAPPLVAEVERILQLPLMPWLNANEEDEVNRRHVLAPAYNAGWRLFNTQANAISAYERFNGVMGFIAVGWGKTLICLKVADLAIRKGARCVVLMVPANVCGQLWDHDIGWARRHIALSIEFFNLHGMPAERRKAIAAQGKRGCYIFPYSLLSRADAYDILTTLMPTTIVCDEGDLLSDEKSARTRRWMHYVRDHKPEVVCMSGSFTAKAPSDYRHLIFPALRDYCPLPHSAHLVAEWSAVLGSKVTDIPKGGGAAAQFAQSVAQASSASLMPVLRWARENFPRYLDRLDDSRDALRLAYQMRLTTAPGVIATGDNEIGVSLTMENRPVVEKERYPGWDKLSELLEQLENQWVTPSGDILEHQLLKFKWFYELAAGFYNDLRWPEAGDFARKRGIQDALSEQILQAARDHHAAGQEYSSELRKWFGERHIPGLDTPMLVGRDMHVNGARNVGAKLFAYWHKMKSLEFEGMPGRDPKAVRVCPYKVWAAVEWAREFTTDGDGGIIWYYNQEIGAWIYDELVNAGASNVLHCRAGALGSEQILDKANAKKCIVASIPGHFRGKNLQHFQNQVMVQWPRSAKMAEQLLGRLHRNGQKADSIVAHRMDTLEFDRMVFAACLVDAVYIQQTTGNRQKVVFANYDPLPTLYPPEFLRERGFENENVSREMMETLRGNMEKV